MTPDIFFWLAIGGLAITHFTAIGSRVMQDISWHELKHYCKRHKNRERFDEVHDHSDRVSTCVDSLLVVSIALLAVAAMAWWQKAHGTSAGLLDFLILLVASSVILLASVVWIPHAVAEVASTPFLYHTWRYWFVLSQLSLPMTYGVEWIKWLSRRLAGWQEKPSEEEAFDEEIRAIVTEGQEDGLLEEEVREMIEGVIELDERDAADIMTPRSEMDVIHVDMEMPGMLEAVVGYGRTRIPMCGKNHDDIVGVLYVKDLLAELAKENPNDRKSIQSILREPCFVPKTKRLDELLSAFLRTRNHLAIVVDEYMNVAGLVTIEDVLEEIVGEIVDESDKDEHLEPIRHLSDDLYEIDGRVHLDEINEQFGTDIPQDGDYDTIAGFVVAQLSRIPKDGETLQWQNLRMTIVEATKRKVRKIRLQELALSPAPTGVDSVRT